MRALADCAARGFAAAFGAEAAGVWSAPGRVNLIGEHTDYNEGFVLPFAIAARTAVAAAPRADGLIAIASARYPGEVVRIPLADVAPGTVSGWSAYPAGVAWALGQAGGSGQAGRGRAADAGQAVGSGQPGRRPGVSLYVDSVVPAGSGLSSSAALECAVARALDDLWDLRTPGTDLARACQLAENEVVGAPTGIMDQFASLFGEAGAAVFLDCRDISHEIVPLDLEAVALTILLADTRERHNHASGGYADRRASCERAARVLGVRALRDVTAGDLEAAAGRLDEESYRRARHVVTEDERVRRTVLLLRDDALAKEPAAVGALLTASHASMRDDFEITTPALDLAVETALGAGAFGARMTGGGFGGAIIALVPAARAGQVGETIAAVFEQAGRPAPEITTVTPSAGARRDR
ncbi:MAG TPA: galactokinase [Trebonia sp.]